jgi:phosphatidylethanolamine/phosphatidyl-N-methylethanolamine N-methyltransferase
LSDEARFFKALFENPLRTGAISPSGRFLARMMARYVEPEGEGAIVELGPGTGPVTQALLRRGVAPERLTLVEYDAAFCDLLRRRFPKCRVIQGDAYDLRTTLDGVVEGPVACVVSSLPLLNCPEDQRRRLIGQAFAMMRPDGCFVQFTYGMVSPLPLRSREGMPRNFWGEASPPVLLNLPPARVWIYRVSKRPAKAKKPRPGMEVIGLIKAKRDKVRDEILETRDKVGSRLRAHAAKARAEIAEQTRKVRDDKSVKPALALLKRIGDQRRPG